MAEIVEIKVPPLPESVADAVVAKWHAAVGATVERDQNLVDLETDKVMLEVPSPVSGVIQSIERSEGSKVVSHEVLAKVTVGAVAGAAAKTTASSTAPVIASSAASTSTAAAGPSARRSLTEHQVDPASLTGTGKGQRITKEDVMKALIPKETSSAASPVEVMTLSSREEKRVPMSRLRARVAERLLAAKNETAMLTTFNEVDMHAIIDIRNQYKETFEKQHQVRLGFMSFFVKAVVAALKQFPSVNASLDGEEVVYHGYFDIGIAVSAPRGLVVPIIRDADRLSMAQIEQAIVDYANKAKENKLTLEEITGGTFTITNGGIFGSMLSTPILNPPQSAILGMHNIVKRPVVINEEIVIRPMMYLALSYDHRIIDGRESVSFLVAIKQALENPERLLLGV